MLLTKVFTEKEKKNISQMFACCSEDCRITHWSSEEAGSIFPMLSHLEEVSEQQPVYSWADLSKHIGTTFKGGALFAA